MRVLLVSADTEQINMPVLPLGLACVAAAVKNAKHDVKMLNLMMQEDTRKAIKEAILGFDPKIIGITVRNIDDQNMENPRFLLEAVKDVVAHCREFSDATIVLGGAGYSIFPQATLDFLKADIGIQGEGESTFLTLLERLDKKNDISAIPGLYLRGHDSPSEPSRIKSLADIPLPLPEIYMSTPSMFKDREIWIPFQTRRGCSLNCNYCSTATIEGLTIRKHDPKNPDMAGYEIPFGQQPVKTLFSSLSAEAVFQREEPRIQGRQGFSKFCQFFFRAVNFQTGEVGNLQGLFKQRAHIFKMGQHALGIFIAFTAMDLIFVKAEPVIKTFGFLIGFLDKSLAQHLKRLELATVNFEIRNDRTAFVLSRHNFLLCCC